MLYLVNPSERRAAKKRRVSKKRPSAKQRAARKKFAAMAKARAKAARSKKRATKGGRTMAARKRRAAPKRRRRASAKRRSPVVTLRRRTVYQTNPRRRRGGRRRSYRRNPGLGNIGGQVIDLLKSSGFALAGAAVGRTVSGLIPIGSPTDPIINFAKNTVVAIAIRTFGARVIGQEAAKMAAVGAMLGPTKDLIVGFVPQAESFLGRSDAVMYLPRIPAGRMSSYAGADPAEIDSGMGSYSGEAWVQ